MQRDFLLSLAVEGLYRPLWSQAILEELEDHEHRKLLTRHSVPGDAAAARASHLVGQMRSSFRDAMVVGWEGLEGTYGLPDPNDEHVVAAAFVGGAGAIVTHNVKDFPADKVPTAIQVLRPADFLLNTVAVDPVGSMNAVVEMSNRLGRKGRAMTPDEVLNTLASRYNLHDVVAFIRE